MDDLTINSEVTMSGENATVLAGRYRIVRQLGQGGMGSVWLAEDTKLDGFKVAIKMLPSVLVNNKRAYAQVKAEALVSLKLSHPNIATVRAFEEEGGNPFLVMDYIDGQTLDDYLAEKGKLSEDETVKLLKPVAAALDYAHQQGVVHRDVKPGNVMIRKDGTPFVLDFGIAREIQETMTRVTGKLSSGTLLYMSPEQLNGEAPKPAQDIYSFAAMAYECLKGEPPFSRGQVEFQILNKDPEPLPGGSDLARSILRGLAKAPVARPGSCKDVVTLVAVGRPKQQPRFREPLWSAVPKRTIPASEPERSGKWIVPAVLVLVAVACVGGWLRLEKLKSERLATERARKAEVARREAAERDHEAREREKNEKLEREKRQEEERLARQKLLEEEKSRKSRADDTRVEANVQVSVCRRIDDADGFKKLIGECIAAFDKAEALYAVSKWGDATAGFSNVVERCKNVIRLDELREGAAPVRSAMVESCRKAQAAGAATYAKTEFDSAVEIMRKSAEEAKAMHFDSAKILYADAKVEFEKSISQAEREKQKIARKEADDRARVERQREIDKAAERGRYRTSDAGVRDRLVGKWQSTRYHRKILLDGSVTIEDDIVDTYEFLADGTYFQSALSNSRLAGANGGTMKGSWRIVNGELELRKYGTVYRMRLRWFGDESFVMQWRSVSGAVSLSGDVDGGVRVTQKIITGVIFKTDSERVYIGSPCSFKRIR